MQDSANSPPAVVIGEEEDVMEVDEGSRFAELIALRNEDISQNEKDSIRGLLRGGGGYKQSDIVIDKFNIDITVSKLFCLRPNTWLNDEIVNFYMCMLQERDERLCDVHNGASSSGGNGNGRLRSHYFNSFFISKLLEGGSYSYANVKRWSKKFDVFALDKVFMPINLHNTHWVMAVVHVVRKEIHYYDSMSGSGRKYLQAILRWLQDEAREKKQVQLDASAWQLIDQEDDVPQQHNGVDCGVFSIICADYVSDNLPLQYSQSEMENNRLKIASAIRRGTLTY